MEAQRALPGLEHAIRRGGIHYGLAGASKPEVLAAAVQAMRLPRGTDRRFLLDVLLQREALGSTAVGEGMAIPHVRDPSVIPVRSPSVAVCFLQTPVQFGALDGKPVHTLFAIVSPTVRAHLHLLSLVSFALRREEFRLAVLSREGRPAVLAAARAVDEAARARAEAAGG